MALKMMFNLFASRRGNRTLIASVQEKLVTYFVAKGTTVRELTTVRPADPSQVEGYMEEWGDAAEAAGVTDKLDKM